MALTVAKYKNIPKLANVQGFWRFEGDFTDLSSNGYTLTETGGTIPFVNGKIGRAGDFELDDTEYLTIANASCANLNITGDMTISALINAESLGANELCIVAKWDGSTSNQKQYRLYISTLSQVSFAISQDTSAIKTLNGNTAISTGNWYAVAATFNATTHYIDVYLNGSNNGSLDTTYTAIGTDTENFFIGACLTAGSPDEYFDGLIDEVLIWNALLTPAEISWLHGMQMAGTYDLPLSTGSGSGLRIF